MKKSLALVLLMLTVLSTTLCLAEEVKLYLYPTGEVEINISRTYTQNISPNYEGYMELNLALDTTQVNRTIMDLELMSSVVPTITELKPKNRTTGTIGLEMETKSNKEHSFTEIILTLDLESEERGLLSLSMLGNFSNYINGTVIMKGDVAISISSKALSPTQVNMILAILNKNSINNMLKSQGINFIEVEELETELETTTETYELEIAFSTSMDIDRYAEWAERKGIASATEIVEKYRKTFIDLEASLSMSTDFETETYETELQEYLKAYNVTMTLYIEAKGELRRIIEVFKEIPKGEGISTSPSIKPTLPPELEKYLEESKEFLSKISSELRKIEIAPSKTRLKLSIRALESKVIMNILLTGLKLRSKDKKGIEGLREVLSAIKGITISINELSRRELKKPLLPSTVEIVGKASRDKIVKIEQTKVPIEELDRVLIKSEEYVSITSTTPTIPTTSTTLTTPTTEAPIMPIITIAIGMVIGIIIVAILVVFKLGTRRSS